LFYCFFFNEMNDGLYIRVLVASWKVGSETGLS